MRWLLTLALLALMTWPTAAQENEAEKLFRELEQKVRAAKTLEVRFDSIMTGRRSGLRTTIRRPKSRSGTSKAA
jgi:hypothetical protein